MERFRVVASLAAACIILATSATACAASPIAPTPPDEPIATITYAINVPSARVAQGLQAIYPDGVLMAPVIAQQTYDFREEYAGTPNVYWGPTAPPTGQYQGVGIVVAPVEVAKLAVFKGSAWPSGCPAVQCRWLGRFAYANAFGR